MFHELDDFLKVEVALGKDTSVTRASYETREGDVLTAEGRALRHHHDNPDETTGELLAAGRAIEKLGRKMRERGESRVKHREDVRCHRRKRHQEKEGKGAHPDARCTNHGKQHCFNHACCHCGEERLPRIVLKD